ncbi:MAG TPA: phage tail sheath subtilisin-like domain-containing protein [Nannocystaceae bacterium]|nr:phage tail sheath subtilisin-like domain-containing protein [Nannocystaceae bacterium]
MAVQPSYPGVYIEELPKGTRTIVGVATSITAFVGRTRWGAVEHPIDCFSFADFERECGGLWADSELGQAVAQFFLAGGGQAIVCRVATGATTSTTTIAGVTGGSLALTAASAGAWGGSLRVTVDHGTSGSLDETPDDLTFHLELAQLDAAGQTFRREQFFAVSVDPAAPRWIGRLLEQESKLARVTAAPARRPIEVNAQAFSSAIDGGNGSVTDYTAAIDRLDHVDTVNLVCVPPLSATADTPLAVWTAAEALCKRRRAMLVVDPPAAWATAQNAADLAGGMTALRSENAAFYWPAIIAPDPLQEGRPRRFAPCGVVAGTIARIDANRGVWKSPAGIEATLPGVLRTAIAVTDADSGLVNPRGVNALRDRPPAGAVIWGARTARGADLLASQWKYLAVRRLALYIEESLWRGTQWAVFEPNDAPLWTELRKAIDSFMQQLMRQGALQGARASDAYFVRCDSTTTTADDVDRGIVNIIVGFAPLQPAEFVVLHFKQIAGQ